MDAQLEEILRGMSHTEVGLFLKAFRLKYGKGNNVEVGIDDFLDDALGLTPLDE